MVWSSSPTNARIFQSTLPRRERLFDGVPAANDWDFNPRSREGSDRRQHRQRLTTMLFQSTLPRRERPRSSNRNIYSNIISIHAPAKGATGRWAGRLVQVQFQSTLPRRERQGHWVITASSKQFQSTLPRRERRCRDYRRSNSSCISIHAPAKGATAVRQRDRREAGHFNPRSREGSDKVISKFPCTQAYFNPRSREGSDLIRQQVDHHALKISIHAPAKGATPALLLVFNPILFQSTLPRRERPDRP